MSTQQEKREIEQVVEDFRDSANAVEELDRGISHIEQVINDLKQKLPQVENDVLEDHIREQDISAIQSMKSDAGAIFSDAKRIREAVEVLEKDAREMSELLEDIVHQEVD